MIISASVILYKPYLTPFRQLWDGSAFVVTTWLANKINITIKKTKHGVSKEAAHNEADNDVSSLLSSLMEDTAKQTTMAKKYFLNSVSSFPKKGRRSLAQWVI